MPVSRAKLQIQREKSRRAAVTIKKIWKIISREVPHLDSVLSIARSLAFSPIFPIRVYIPGVEYLKYFDQKNTSPSEYSTGIQRVSGKDGNLWIPHRGGRRGKQLSADWEMMWVPGFTMKHILYHLHDCGQHSWQFYRLLSPICELTLLLITGSHFIGSMLKMYSRSYKAVFM